MKKLVIYTSQTGFTKQYAQWLAKEVGADVEDLENVRKKPMTYFDQFDQIVYGGWVSCGKVAKADQFFKMAKQWKDKKMALFLVGATPGDSPYVDKELSNAVPQDQKDHIKAFYLPGGIRYEKLNFTGRMIMKAYAGSLKKSKNEETKKMGEIVSESFDISDRENLKPLIEYLGRS